MLAKVGIGNRITLPKVVVDAFRDTEYFDIEVEDGRIVLSPLCARDPEIVREKLARLGIREADFAAAVRWSRKRR